MGQASADDNDGQLDYCVFSQQQLQFTMLCSHSHKNYDTPVSAEALLNEHQRSSTVINLEST